MQEIFAGGLRLAGLGARMALTLFMARYLSFSDIGVFSLLVGTVALVPGAAGLGISYFVNRAIVAQDASSARRMSRDRLFITVFCGLVSVVLILAGRQWSEFNIPINMWVFSIILLIEMIGFDLHYLLIARSRVKLANLLFFVRSAGWIPIYITLAFVFPALRNINALLVAWLAGAVLFLALTTFFLRHVIDKRFWTTPIDTKWFGALVPRAGMVWASDLSLAIGQNVDRFVVSAVIGVEAAGVYFFFFSIANAAFQIIQSATIQPFMPGMRQKFSAGKIGDFVEYVGKSLRKVIAFATIASIIAGVGAITIVKLLNRTELSQFVLLVPIIAPGIISKSVVEYFGIIDYVMENDMRYIMTATTNMVVAIALLFVLTAALGLFGAALAFAITMLTFGLYRWVVWRKRAAVMLRV